MPITPAQIRQAVDEANTSLSRGSVARADLICQSVLEHGVRPVEILFIEGRVATAIGDYATARRRFEELLGLQPSHPVITRALSDLTRLEQQRLSLEAAAPAQTRERFHVIKAWGYGFTADLDHTLGHLLLAEMTGRTPIIHWGQNSLFRDVNVENAWLEFFEPISTHIVRELARNDHTFFPSKWSADNLLSEEINKLNGPGSRVAGIEFLRQTADVTVGDFFTGVIELLPWVRAPHPLAPTGPVNPPAIESAYRYLIDRYVKPRAEIIAAVDSFAAQHFHGREMLAVHIRGSDKIGEMANLADGHRRIFETVQAGLAANPRLSIFLLTDDAKVREQYFACFPDRVITTDCQRTTTSQGVHYLPAPSRRQLGFELLCDMYLAARCDRLIGLGFTNVSNLILHLKQWPPGTVRLVGQVIHHHRNFVIHG